MTKKSSFTSVLLVVGFSTLLLACHQVWGADASPKIIKSSFQLVEEPGKTSRLVFADGREALLWTSQPLMITVKVPLKVTENYCVPAAKAPKCYYEVSARISRHNFIWSKNPDVSRMGQKVQVIRVQQTNPDGSPKDFNYEDLENEDNGITYFMSFIKKELRGLVPVDRLICDDYRWIPQSSGSNDVVMKLWSGEIMSDNQETSINENASFMSFENLVWAKNQNALTIKSIERMNGTAMIPPLTDTSMILFEQNNKECQISMGGSLLALQMSVRDRDPGPLVGPAEPLIRTKLVPNFRSVLETIKNLLQNYGEVGVR